MILKNPSFDLQSLAVIKRYACARRSARRASNEARFLCWPGLSADQVDQGPEHDVSALEQPGRIAWIRESRPACAARPDA